MSSEANDLPYTVGSKPHKVRVYRRKGRTNLYMRRWDPNARDGEGGWRKRSLGHDDVEKAKQQAAELHAKLVKGEEEKRGGAVTLARLFARYRREESPRKCERGQISDKRRAAMWTRVLGSDRDPRDITPREWRRFLERRRSGAIDARGHAVPEGEREGVGNRSLEADTSWLKTVVRWGVDAEGIALEQNPLESSKRFPVPSESSPRRVAADEDRYRRTLAVADNVHPFLRTMLVVANETGRRIGAIRRLRRSDVMMERGEHGKVRWRAEWDKIKDAGDNASVVPLSQQAADALERHVERFPGMPEAWLFPHPEKPGEPVTHWYPAKWLKEAEEAADLEPLDGKQWHAYRAKFATDMMDRGVSVAIIKKVGGWKKAETILDIYGQPNDDDVKRALERRHAAA